MRAVLVPVAGEATIIGWNENAPASWAGLIGAEQIDLITLRESGLQVFVGDRSMLDGSPQNERMTWFLRGTGRWLSEVRGPVLLVGINPDSGESADVPEMLADALTTIY